MSSSYNLIKMANYISIISRSDFSDLYKFGHLFVHNLIPFDGELNEHFEDKPLFDAVTRYMNTYEYSTEYLLLHINRIVFAGSVAEIFIKDVSAVYALDSESQASLSVSLDPRINIQVSCWEPFFKDLNKRQLIRQANSGKFNCYEIFGITDIDRNKIENFISRDFLNELFSDLFDNKRPIGKKNIWTYLLRYDRHGAFWKDNRGYFSDAVNVFENYLNEKEMSYEWDDELKFADIIENSGTRFSEICRILTSKVTPDYKVPGCNYFAVAPLFLYMKDYFGDKGITPSLFSQNDLFSKGTLYEMFGLDFALAVALLGIKFGHDLTYGCYYEIKDLGIFNKTPAPRKTGITDPSTGKELSISEIQVLLEELSFKNEELKEKLEKLQGTLVQDDSSVSSEFAGNQSKQESLDSNETRIPVLNEGVSAELGETNEPKSNDVEFTTPEFIQTNISEIPDLAESKESKKNEDVEEGVILTSKIGQEDNIESTYPILMRNIKKDGKIGRKTAYAHNKEEEMSLLKSGWVRDPEQFNGNSLFG